MKVDKKSERARILGTRNALSLEKRAELNESLCRYLSVFLDAVNVLQIGAFLPIGSEPNISPALKRWLSADPARQVFLPVTEDKTMRFALWDPSLSLRTGKFGVQEPTTEIFSDPMLLLVPCVGLDLEGYRLGYGGGYYDRYLSHVAVKPLTAGICFFEFCHLNFETDSFDAKLDSVISDEGIFNY